MPLPDKIANKPTLHDGLFFYWQAFADLSPDRASGMGDGPIPWSAIDRYGYRHDIWGDEFDRLVYIIRGLDIEFLRIREAKTKKGMGKHSGKIGKAKMRQR